MRAGDLAGHVHDGPRGRQAARHDRVPRRAGGELRSGRNLRRKRGVRPVFRSAPSAPKESAAARRSAGRTSATALATARPERSPSARRTFAAHRPTSASGLAAGDADCVAGEHCLGGSCGPKHFGVACGADAECDSGHCANGVCCNSACGGACQSCNQVGFVGSCTPTPSGQTHPLCLKQDPATCGTTGVCDGKGGCSSYPANSPCGPATCVDSILGEHRPDLRRSRDLSSTAELQVRHLRLRRRCLQRVLHHRGRLRSGTRLHHPDRTDGMGPAARRSTASPAPPPPTASMGTASTESVAPRPVRAPVAAARSPARSEPAP